MGMVSWILLGLIAGLIARFLMPGKAKGGFVITTLLGMIGAIVGGWLASLAGVGTTGGLSLGGVALAVVGALVILALYGFLTRK